MIRRRTLFTWHSWIGLTLGLLLFVICWSGTIAVFSHEIDWLLNPDIRANVATAPIDWQAAHNAVAAARPGWEIGSINAPRYSGFAIEVLAEPQPDVSFRVYVDPVTYQVLGDTSYFNVQRFFRSFHMALFDTSGDSGLTIAGVWLGYFVVAIMAVPLLISLITPLIFYRRWWRGFFKLERRKGRKVFWSDVHKLTGLWSLPVGLVIAATGLWYLIEWWTPEPPYGASEQAIAAPYLPVSDLVEHAARAKPDLEIKAINLPSGNDGIFDAVGQDGTVLVRDSASVTLNAATGAVLNVTSPSGAGLYFRWIDTADPLHFGNFGGLLSQALYFLAGLGLSGLILSGVYLQAQRQKRKLMPDGRRVPVLAAYAATGAILVASTVGAIVEIRSYGLTGEWPEVNPAVLIFITAWCVSTLAALTLWMRSVR